MGRRIRWLRIFKWAGTFACILIAAAFVVSIWCDVGYWWEMRRYGYSAEFSYGAISLGRLPDVTIQALVPFWPAPGWHSQKTLPHWTNFRASQFPSYKSLRQNSFVVFVPFWIPFVVLLIPTLLLWRKDRRRSRPGMCRQCGYDLTGNVSGKCPECGIETGESA